MLIISEGNTAKYFLFFVIQLLYKAAVAVAVVVTFKSLRTKHVLHQLVKYDAL